MGSVSFAQVKMPLMILLEKKIQIGNKSIKIIVVKTVLRGKKTSRLDHTMIRN